MRRDERKRRLSSLFLICCPEGGRKGKRMERIPINTERKGEDGRERKTKRERERRKKGEREKKEGMERMRAMQCMSGTSDEMLMHPFFQVTGFFPSRTRYASPESFNVNNDEALSLSVSSTLSLSLCLFRFPTVSLSISFLFPLFLFLSHLKHSFLACHQMTSLSYF